jgi:hypothetical protein
MEGVGTMRMPITPSALEVFGKAALEPARHRRVANASRAERRSRTPARPIAALLVAARLRAARV